MAGALGYIQGLVLALCSGIIPSREQGSIWNVGDLPQGRHVQDKRLTKFSLYFNVIFTNKFILGSFFLTLVSLQSISSSTDQCTLRQDSSYPFH